MFGEVKYFRPSPSPPGFTTRSCLSAGAEPASEELGASRYPPENTCETHGCQEVGAKTYSKLIEGFSSTTDTVHATPPMT